MRRRLPFGGDNRFDRFTDDARKVLSLAQEEAQRFHHNYIGTEHLLLGLLGQDETVAAVVLRRLGVDRDGARATVERIIGRGDRVVPGDIGLTPRAKKVLELAEDEAIRVALHYIDTEHILLGLLREGEGIAARVLEGFGLRLEVIRTETLRVLMGRQSMSAQGAGAGSSEAPSVQPGAGPKNNVITCRLDDRSLDALDTLVEAGVRATRSDAAAWLIAAGIESHQELFARLASTIQTIRQLRQDAQAIANEVVSSPQSAGTAEPTRADQGEAATDDSTPKRDEDADGGDGVA